MVPLNKTQANLSTCFPHNHLLNVNSSREAVITNFLSFGMIDKENELRSNDSDNHYLNKPARHTVVTRQGG